ncbi:MAG: FAD-dependent oxidoreductase [Candidatus Wallbacteria bacterium]|nr:FAD-dependent oxidoreductase [Candidatus Wallbacteria bacterium]
MSRVAVIGAGIAGLSCARELARAGCEVVVFEAQPSVGGRMSTRVRDGLAFDIGANFLVDAYTLVHRLAAGCGLTVVDVGPVPHVFLRDGRWRPMNMSRPADVARLSGLSLRTRLRLLLFALRVRLCHPGLDFFDLSCAPEELNTGDAFEYCTRMIDLEFARYILDSFCSCMMFHAADELSPAAFVSLLGEMLDPAFNFGIQHLAGEMVALPRALAEPLDVRLSTPVLDVRASPGGFQLATDSRTYTFDQIVLATTAPAARRILSRPAPDLDRLLSGVRYAATLNVSFRVPADTLGPTHCFYVPRCENAVVSEFTNEAVKGTRTFRAGWSLANAGLHEDAARDLLAEPDARVFATVKRELLSLHPGLAAVPESVLPHDLARWPEAMPKYSAAHIARLAQLLPAIQGRDNLWFAGDWLGGPWLEGAARSGLKAAASVLKALGKSRDQSGALPPNPHQGGSTPLDPR